MTSTTISSQECPHACTDNNKFKTSEGNNYITSLKQLFLSLIDFLPMEMLLHPRTNIVPWFIMLDHKDRASISSMSHG